MTLAGMPITMLNGFGCAECGGTCASSLGAVNDYDVIRIGGSNYTVNQILDKTIIANKQTKLYSSANKNSTVKGTVQAGKPIGKVYSYLKPSQTADGNSWLMFEDGYLNYFFVPNENVTSDGLKEQGTLTLKEELAKEEEQKKKESSPIEYYIEKYAFKALLIGGAIYLGGVLLQTGVKSALTRKTESTT